MTMNTNFALPFNPNSTDDINAAQRNMEFAFGWFMDPQAFGDYPESMKNLTGGRLPTFTADQSALLKGSFDFIGLNHYTSNYVQSVTNPGSDWGSDSMGRGSI